PAAPATAVAGRRRAGRGRARPRAPRRAHRPRRAARPAAAGRPPRTTPGSPPSRHRARPTAPLSSPAPVPSRRDQGPGARRSGDGLVVAAAVVGALTSPRLLPAARRPAPAALAGGGELPGGKVEPGADPAAALHREIGEELGVGL